jgi:ATP-dependent Clp protease ATP-binding subunit ClpA
MRRVQLHPSAALAWDIANLEAWRGASVEILPIHLLGSILRILDGTHLLDAVRLTYSAAALEACAEPVSRLQAWLGLAPDALTDLRRSIRRVYLTTEDVGSPPLRHRAETTRRIFSQGAYLAQVADCDGLSMEHLLQATLVAQLSELAARLPSAISLEGEPGVGLAGRPPGQTPTLDSVGRDLTRLASEGRLPPFVGRHDLLLNVARTLLRTSKPNVILVGEAGVGKTAVVEGLAQYAASGNAPSPLDSFRFVELSIPSLVAGAAYRGEMEQRAKSVILEASKEPSLILFLDEIHLALGAGRVSDSSMDLANILKPALARGEIRCIGATTAGDFDRYLKADRAFLRRFQVIPVPEMNPAEALEACTAWAARLQDSQGVMFAPEAIAAAVEVSSHLMLDRHLPDKAIDILESAAVSVRLPTLSIQALAPSKTPVTIQRGDILQVAVDQFGALGETPGRLMLEAASQRLNAELVGQPIAVKDILSVLGRLAQEPEGRDKPLGALLFVGPTGVGKTYAAELIGQAVSTTAERGLCRINMNEYKERHELSRIMGAPPGFIGHDQPGILARYLSSNPTGVILLDELEKAHPEIQDYFLQILDTGQALDSKGFPMDFRTQLIIITCNTQLVEGEGSIGFRLGAADKSPAVDKDRLSRLLADDFRPEFLARLDAVVLFQPFDVDSFRELYRRLFSKLSHEVEGRGGAVTSTDDVRDLLCREALASSLGARGMERLFSRYLEAPTAELQRTTAPPAIHIRLVDGKPTAEAGGGSPSQNGLD